MNNVIYVNFQKRKNRLVFFRKCKVIFFYNKIKVIKQTERELYDGVVRNFKDD